jgi:hypothetical protein
MNDGTTNQSVVWSDMDFIRVLGILESGLGIVSFPLTPVLVQFV